MQAKECHISFLEHVRSSDGFFEQNIFTHLNHREIATLSQTSTEMYKIYKLELTVRKLLTYVIRGEESQAFQMIDGDPRLLLFKSQAVDYSGRMIRGTAFQAALGAEDYIMAEKMLPYFKRLETNGLINSSEYIIKTQFNAQFPHDMKDVPASGLQLYYNDLAQAIVNDGDHQLSAIGAFRKAITNNKVIASGKHFNMQHLLAAYQAYIDNFALLKNWDYREIFWKKVIGYVLRHMPANYAQAHCCGLWRVNQNALNFKRILDLDNGHKFYPVVDGVGLGFDLAMDSSGSMTRRICVFTILASSVHMDLGYYVTQKSNDLAKMRDQVEQWTSYQPK